MILNKECMASIDAFAADIAEHAAAVETEFAQEASCFGCGNSCESGCSNSCSSSCGGQYC